MALSTKVRLMITAPLLGLVGFGLGTVGLGEYSTSSSLESGGVEVPGQVVDGLVKSGRRGAKTYYLTVSYEAKPGSLPSQREFEVSKSGYEKAEQAQGVQVRVLPGDSKVAQIVGEESSGLFYLVIGAGLLVASLFLFLQVFKKDKPPAVSPAA